jgi:hypothetical protein
MFLDGSSRIRDERIISAAADGACLAFMPQNPALKRLGYRRKKFEFLFDRDLSAMP